MQNALNILKIYFIDISNKSGHHKALHLFDKRGLGVWEDVSVMASQRAARHEEVYPQIRVISFHRQYWCSANTCERLRWSKHRAAFSVRAARCVYLDGGDVKRRGDAEHGHDDGLVFLIDVDLHVSDVLLAGHLGNVLVRHVRLSGSEGETWEEKSVYVKLAWQNLTLEHKTSHKGHFF